MLRCLALSSIQEPASRPFCNYLSHPQLQQGRCSYHILQPRSKGGYMSKLALLATLLVVGATAANAQTTYNQTAPLTCKGSGYYPITSGTQFDCRGVTYQGGIETVMPEFEIFTYSRVAHGGVAEKHKIKSREASRPGDSGSWVGSGWISLP